MNKLYSVLRLFVSNKVAAFLLLALLGLGSSAGAQHILVVNDNDNILYNTDTIVNDLNHSSYSSYQYWSIPDSAGATPSLAYMSAYDLVIWYCSTDGAGLKIWNGSGTSGNPDLVSYAAGGKPVWIIGLDILYQKYTEGTTFTAGEFPKDIMGLTSYDVQSYIDDTSTGCPLVSRIATASTLFPDTLHWGFPTLWYVDGCTPQPGTLSLYQMGPSSYSLSGKKCMFHNKQSGMSVMSTFFDPALIDNFLDRVNFLEKGITYLLGPLSASGHTVQISSAKLFPNPATESFTLEVYIPAAGEVTIELFSTTGNRVKQQRTMLATGKNRITTSLSELSTGLYFVKVTDATGNAMYSGKLSKQ